MTTTSTKAQAAHLLDQFAASFTFPSPTGFSQYIAQPTDIIVSTYPKAGTTLLIYLTYQVVVATGGAPPFDPDGTQFDDIAQIAPWLDYGPEFGVLECPSSPRVFKTHARVGKFDTGKSRFIYGIRDPLQYPASMLDFLFNQNVPGVTDLEVRREVLNEYARRKLIGDGDGGEWFEHVREWALEGRENVLVVFYEDVVKDLGGTAKRIARFMGRSLSDEGVEVVADRCGKGKMVNDPRFDLDIVRRGLGLGENIRLRLVREGNEGFKSLGLDEEVKRRFGEVLKKRFGVGTYGEFCEMVRQKQGQKDG